MKIKLKSKWTSINLIDGWRHYEIRNCDKEKKQFELFAVCDNSVTISIHINDLNDRKKWIPGWKQIVES